jgi:pimeloyl-ACP methyl ester carboxylesterase
LNKRGLRSLGLIALLQLLAGCAFQPQFTIRKLCVDCQEHRLEAAEFTLQAFSRNMADSTSYPLIHIYLEGDGQPWRRGRCPAANPSSRHLTALQLMMSDPRPSLYLNRPCYGLDRMPANCTADLWTGGRYSAVVVDAMRSALDQLGRKFPGKSWLLIGHSGGGSLAVLIAQGRTDVAGLITLAANLDIDAWTRHFGYLPLAQSLNPATMPQLPDGILRWHYAATRDHQVPSTLIAEAAQRDSHARFILLEGDHECCWQHHWPHIPQEMAARLSQ